MRLGIDDIFLTLLKSTIVLTQQILLMELYHPLLAEVLEAALVAVRLLWPQANVMGRTAEFETLKLD